MASSALQAHLVWLYDMRISTPSTARGIPAPNSIRRSSISGAASRPAWHEVLYWESIPGRLFGETRKDEKMTPVAADLTHDDIRGPGAYFGSLPGPPAPTEADPDPALTKAGAALVKDRHCAQCHPAVCRSGRNSAIGWATSGNDRKSVARLSARRAPRARQRHHAGDRPFAGRGRHQIDRAFHVAPGRGHETVTVRPTPRVEPRAR